MLIMVYSKEITMSKVAVCIPTSTKRTEMFEELTQSLHKQTFKDFKIYSVNDIKPIGKAKYEVVEEALKGDHKYICMIDDDDLIEPTYLEKLVERLDKGDVDWAFTWGSLFQDREGYIHGEIQPFEEIIQENHRPSQFMAKAELFKKVKYNQNTSWAEDLELWIVLDYLGYKGAVVEEELYLRRWHEENLTMTHDKA
jgi:glycosyltransferase involved in cell wall biosynthesis